jgi:hypothetical protein
VTGVLKKILLVVLLLALIAGGVVFYLFWQATSLPDWYAEELAAPADEPAEPPQTPDGMLAWSDAPAADGGAKKKKVLRNFHRRAARKDPTVAKVVKASRASYEDGVLELGVVADLRDLPKDRLSGDQAAFFEKVRASFPSATDREIYLGVEDASPSLHNDQIVLGPDARLKVGNLSYDIDDAAARLGMPAAQLREQFNQQARLLGVSAPPR